MAGDLGRRPGLGRSDLSGQAAEWDAGPAENELQGRRGRATSCSATGPSPHWAAGIRLMARPAFPAHCRRCAAVQVDGTDGQAPRQAGPIVRAARTLSGSRHTSGTVWGACSARSRRRRLPGSSLASAARTARSAQDSLGALTCRWSRATWFAGSRSPHPWHRRTRQARRASRTCSSARLASRIDASTDSADPGDSAQQMPNMTVRVRASHQVNGRTSYRHPQGESQ